MHILTSSQKMQDALDPLKCPRTHDHQPIEGTTKVHGIGIARPAFSERYPRKFARLVAKCMLVKRFPKEQPIGTIIVDSALMAIDQWFQISNALAVDARMTKLSKVPMPRQGKASAEDRSLDAQSNVKRRRFKQPETLSDTSDIQDLRGEITGKQKIRD